MWSAWLLAALSSCSLQGHVCFSACLFGLESLWTWNEPITSLISDPNTTCSDFCSISVRKLNHACNRLCKLLSCDVSLSSDLKGGICDRAFPPDVNSNCLQQCYMETCPQCCRLVEDKFPPQSSADGKLLANDVYIMHEPPHWPSLRCTAVTYPSPLQEMPELSMDYTFNVTLKKEGVLEVQLNYVPPPPPPPPPPFTPFPGFTLPPQLQPSSLPSGVAYGLIWKVTYGEGRQTRTRYISQVDAAVRDFLHWMNTWVEALVLVSLCSTFPSFSYLMRRARCTALGQTCWPSGNSNANRMWKCPLHLLMYMELALLLHQKPSASMVRCGWFCGDDLMSSERGVFALPVQEVGSLFPQMMCL